MNARMVSPHWFSDKLIDVPDVAEAAAFETTRKRAFNAQAVVLNDESHAAASALGAGQQGPEAIGVRQTGTSTEEKISFTLSQAGGSVMEEGVRHNLDDVTVGGRKAEQKSRRYKTATGK